jgi:hypothetical protein
MTVIELPDQQAEALKTKAAAQGLTLEAWLQKLAGVEIPTAGYGKGRYNLSELMAQCDLSAPLSDEDRAWLEAPVIGREA